TPKHPSHHYWHRRERQKRTLDAYRALGPEKLDEMTTALFPELAPYIRRALRSVDRQPYTTGYTSKPFRAPSTPALLDGTRMNFLIALFNSLMQYPADIEWIATWAPNAWPYSDGFVGRLLAAAIDENDEKGQRVFDILLASAKGEHPIGQMGR